MASVTRPLSSLNAELGKVAHIWIWCQYELALFKMGSSHDTSQEVNLMTLHEGGWSFIETFVMGQI